MGPFRAPKGSRIALLAAALATAGPDRAQAIGLLSVLERPPAPISFEQAEEPPYRFGRTLAEAVGARLLYERARHPAAPPATPEERAAAVADYVALQRRALPIPVASDLVLTEVTEEQGRIAFRLAHEESSATLLGADGAAFEEDLAARFCATESFGTLYLLLVETTLVVHDAEGRPVRRVDLDPWSC
jgi:pimeloyl-ACP methyl ester carboxylesterase